MYSSLPYSPIIYFSKCTKPNRSKYHKALSFGEHQDSSNNDTEWLRPYRKLRLIEENSIKWCSFKCRQEFIRDVSWFQLNMTSLACTFINTKDDKQQKLLYSNFRNTSYLGLPTLGQHNFFLSSVTKLYVFFSPKASVNWTATLNWITTVVLHYSMCHLLKIRLLPPQQLLHCSNYNDLIVRTMIKQLSNSFFSFRSVRTLDLPSNNFVSIWTFRNELKPINYWQ